MQDQDTPPAEEGETDGVVDVVREALTPQVATSSTAVSIPLPWITATVPRSPAATMARDPVDNDPALPPTIPRPNPNRCRLAKMRPRAYSASSTTCFSRR